MKTTALDFSRTPPAGEPAADLLDRIHRTVGRITATGLSFGIIVVDADLRIIHWNGWMEKHSGIRKQAILGQNILDRWPDIRERGKDAYLADCIAHQRTALLSPLLHEYFLPLSIVKTRREIRMLQNVKIYPFLDDRTPGAAPDGAVIVIQDMTEGILHEKEIRRLTRLLDAIRNINKLMVRVNDLDDLIRGACDILVSGIGYAFAWIGLWHRDECRMARVAAAPNAEAAVENAAGERCGNDCPVLQTGARQMMDPTRGPDFSRACLERDDALGIRYACCLPLPSENRIIGVLHILSADFDPFQSEELQLLEEYASDIAYAVETIRDRLRRKAAETALRNNEARLRQSQKMEAIGVLAGGIAHDFNNILYPIIGFTEMIGDETPEGVPAREYVDEVLTAAYRARDLVQQILAFSRQSEQITEPVFLAPIIKEALQLLRASLPSSIEIRADIDKRCGPVVADPTHIYQVVMNLCTNAFHAMEATGGVLDIALREIGPSEPFVELVVRDTGCGMDALTQERIFDPYYTTKEQGKGTGMGLAVVHGIVERLGGSIRVTSSPGAGTTFHLSLPKKTPSAKSYPLSESPARAVGPVPGGERILVVDDERQNISIMASMLTDLGYAVTGINDGEEALARFQDDPLAFDLVITDLTMPRLSGETLAREMTRIRSDIPVMLCTGYREKITPDEARAVGIRRVLDKPMGNRLLAEAVRAVLDGDEE